MNGKVTQLARDEESDLLKRELERAKFESYANIIWIKGSSGVGKTLLVESIKQYFKDRGYWFISSKFEENDEIPYNTINQLYQKVVLKCKTEASLCADQEKIRWQASINKGRNLIEYLNQLSRSQSITSKAETDHARNYLPLRLAIIHFYKKLAEQVDRLILFFDDIQWADEVSVEILGILKNLILKGKINKLSVLGSIRNDNTLSSKKENTSQYH